MVTGQDIVNAAYEVKDAPYRLWQPGMSLPTWLDDGRGDPPPVTHLMTMGLECADLVAYALARCGLDYPYQAGTSTFGEFLVGWDWFDPSTPGQAGAICLKPYSGPAWADQGHIAIYADDHMLIQAIGSGVTDQFSDSETWSWGGATEFTIYGFLPGVDYSTDGEAPAPGGGERPGMEVWEELGWWTWATRESWDMKYYPPTPRKP